MRVSNSNQNTSIILSTILGLTALFWLYLNWSISDLSASYVCSNGYSKCQTLTKDSAWFQIVNLDYFSIFNWRHNLILYSLLKNYDFQTYTIIYIAIFQICLTLWLNAKISFTPSFLYALFFTVFSLALYGIDLVTFQTIALLPLTILIVEKLITIDFKFYKILAGLISGLIIAYTSNQLAIIICISILIHIYYLTDRIKESRNLPYLLIPLFIPAIFVLFNIPKLELGNFPNQYLPAPLYTEYAPFNLINREFIRYSFGRSSIIFFLLACLVFSYYRINKYKQPVWALILIFFICLLDSVAPESLSQFGPLEALQRLLPSMFFSPLLPLVFIIGVLLLYKTVITSNSAFIKIVLGIIFSSILYFGPRLTFKAPFLVSNNFINQLISNEKCEITEQLMKGSASVWKKYFKFLPCIRPSVIQVNSLKDITKKITSSEANSKKLNKLIDGNIKTSWRTKEKMAKDNSIEIEFKSNLKIVGLVINTGKHPEQQPNSYKIEYFNSCSNKSSTALENSFHEFRPGLTVTSDGYFYESNKIISIINKVPVNASCIRLSPKNITNKAWSIAELSIIQVE
jgi:hypothetical protein